MSARAIAQIEASDSLAEADVGALPVGQDRPNRRFLQSLPMLSRA